MFTKLVFLLLVLHKVVALERFYQSGSLKDILSGICGPVIQEDSQTIQIKIIVLLKLLRFMAMNMQCIFLFILGLRVEIKNNLQIIKPLSIMGDKWVPIMVGSEQIGLLKMGMTLQRILHKHGIEKALGFQG